MRINIEVCGAEYAEGYWSCFNEYSGPLYPEETNELYEEFYRRYPGQIMDRAVNWGLGTVSCIAQAMEAAQSIDLTDVRDTMGAPGFTFNLFGMECEFGG